MSGRRFTAAIAAVGALSLCATMAFAGAPDAYADTYSSTVVASASTTTAKTPLRPAQRCSQNSFNVALCNSDSQQRVTIVQQ